METKEGTASHLGADLIQDGSSCENPAHRHRGLWGTRDGDAWRPGPPSAELSNVPGSPGLRGAGAGKGPACLGEPFPHCEVLAGLRCCHGGLAPAHGDCQAPGARTTGKPAPVQPQRIRERLPQRTAIRTPPLTVSATEAWCLEQWQQIFLRRKSVRGNSSPRD